MVSSQKPSSSVTKAHAAVQAQLSQNSTRAPPIARRPVVKRRRFVVRYVVVAVLSIASLVSIGRVIYTFYRDPAGYHVGFEIRDDGMDLPDIAVCPLVPINTTSMQDAGLPDDVIETLHWHFVQESYSLMGNQYGDVKISHDDVLKYMGNVSWDEFVGNHSIQCAKLLKYCAHGRPKSKGANITKCCEAAKPIYNNKRGLCHMFTGVKQEAPGIYGGLKILIQVPETKRQNRALIENGIELNLAERIEAPFRTFGFGSVQPIFARSGTVLTINILHVMRSEIMNTQCSTDNSRECQMVQFGNLVARECGCTMLGFRSEPGLKVCNPIELRICYDTKKIVEKSAAEQKPCLPECSKTDYQMTLSQSDLVEENVRYLSNQNATGSEHWILVRIFYSSLRVYKTNEFSLVTFDTVLSQVGGLSGIWLGVSFLSIFDFFWEAGWVRKRYKKNDDGE